MKYLIYENSVSLHTMRLFDDITDHYEVNREVLDRKPGLKLVSAGRCSVCENNDGSTYVSAWPQSVTLNIQYTDEARRNDSEILTRLVNFQV
jgi:hypothetical protein